MARASTTLPLRSCIVTAVAVVVAFAAAREAGASELIARDATTSGSRQTPRAAR